MLRLFRKKQTVKKITNAYEAIFDVRAGNAGWAISVLLPDGYGPSRKDAEKYISKYLAAINSGLMFDEPKRVYAGSLNIYETAVEVKTDTVAVILNLG